MDTEDQETAIPDGRVAAGLREALHDARASIAALIGAEADAQRTIDRQLQRIYELEAIVARLPKTADGVPVTPNTEVWCAFRRGVAAGVAWPFDYGRITVQYEQPINLVDDDDDPVMTHQSDPRCGVVYSTEAAALAAKQTTDTKE